MHGLIGEHPLGWRQVVSLLRLRGFLEGFSHGGEDRAENPRASADDRDRADGAGLGVRVWADLVELGGQVHLDQRVRGAGRGVSAGG
jgi:hypothetical protein